MHWDLVSFLLEKDIENLKPETKRNETNNEDRKKKTECNPTTKNC